MQVSNNAEEEEKMMSDMRVMMMQKCMETSVAEPKKEETPNPGQHKH